MRVRAVGRKAIRPLETAPPYLPTGSLPRAKAGVGIDGFSVDNKAWMPTAAGMAGEAPPAWRVRHRRRAGCIAGWHSPGNAPAPGNGDFISPIGVTG
jgi:hypothetical protein